MEIFPFLNPTAAETEAEYLLQFGFRLIDQRDVPGRILWECEANELLEDSYRLDEYARIHAPLMCMQYPYQVPPQCAVQSQPEDIQLYRFEL